MIKKIGSCVLLASAVLLCNVDSAYAQRATGLGGPTAPQTINLTMGGFFPVGDDNCQDIGCGRVDGDVLVANRSLLVFDFSEFKSFTIGGEYLFPIGNYIEAGAGMSFSQKTVASIYDLFVDSDGTEIDQDLKLRQVPLAFTVRALPLGQGNPIQPYVGGGFGIFLWHYSETGEFVDFSANNAIFEETFEDSGTKVGGIFLAGLRFAGDALSLGGEFRYQKAAADLSTDFLGSKLDLGGWTYQFTLGVRFD
jgi:hypothetical protein